MAVISKKVFQEGKNYLAKQFFNNEWVIAFFQDTVDLSGDDALTQRPDIYIVPDTKILVVKETPDFPGGISYAGNKYRPVNDGTSLVYIKVRVESSRAFKLSISKLSSVLILVGAKIGGANTSWGTELDPNNRGFVLAGVTFDSVDITENESVGTIADLAFILDFGGVSV